MSKKLTVSVKRSLPLLGATTVPGTTREMPPHERATKEIPREQLEEAEQDAADPTHEKEIPPENQR